MQWGSDSKTDRVVMVVEVGENTKETLANILENFQRCVISQPFGKEVNIK